MTTLKFNSKPLKEWGLAGLIAGGLCLVPATGYCADGLQGIVDKFGNIMKTNIIPAIQTAFTWITVVVFISFGIHDLFHRGDLREKIGKYIGLGFSAMIVFGSVGLIEFLLKMAK